MSGPREQTRAPVTPAEAWDRNAREGVAGAVRAVDVRRAGDTTPSRVSNNREALGSGDHGGRTVTTPNGRTASAGAGAEFSRTVTIKAVGQTYVGVDFTGKPAVVLKSGARATFIGCTLNQPKPPVVHNESGGKALFIGCSWLGAKGGGDYIQNDGAAGDVQVIGYMDLGSGAFSGVTVTGGI